MPLDLPLGKPSNDQTADLHDSSTDSIYLQFFSFDNSKEESKWGCVTLRDHQYP